MDIIFSQEALEIGLHVGRVKRALKKRMEEIGTPYTNSDQLIEDVLCNQIMEESTRLVTNKIICYISKPSLLELIIMLNHNAKGANQ